MGHFLKEKHHRFYLMLNDIINYTSPPLTHLPYKPIVIELPLVVIPALVNKHKRDVVVVKEAYHSTEFVLPKLLSGTFLTFSKY
jgi:hypothetical protein